MAGSSPQELSRGGTGGAFDGGLLIPLTYRLSISGIVVAAGGCLWVLLIGLVLGEALNLMAKSLGRLCNIALRVRELAAHLKFLVASL